MPLYRYLSGTGTGGPDLLEVHSDAELWERPLAPAPWGNYPEWIVGSSLLDIALNKEWPKHDKIKRLYASSGPEVIIETLQITIGSDVHYLCQGYEDITATTENGDTVTFTACAIDIALPARNADGTQDLKFALCNIDGVVSTAIRNALANSCLHR
jgi:hypothetical protein